MRHKWQLVVQLFPPAEAGTGGWEVTRREGELSCNKTKKKQNGKKFLLTQKQELGLKFSEATCLSSAAHHGQSCTEAIRIHPHTATLCKPTVSPTPTASPERSWAHRTQAPLLPTWQDSLRVGSEVTGGGDRPVLIQIFLPTISLPMKKHVTQLSRQHKQLQLFSTRLLTIT